MVQTFACSMKVGNVAGVKLTERSNVAGASGMNGGIKEMNENIDIDTTFVPDDSASHSWTERDSELVEEYAAQLMAMSI